MKFLTPLLFASVFLAGMALIVQGQEAHPSSEQTLFSNTSFQRPVTLSPEALRALLASHPAKETLDTLDDSAKANPSQLFQASEIHLSRPDQVDLVVLGMGRMRGVENSWFWVIRSARKDPEVILFGGGDSLEVLATKTSGYRDIRIVWMSSLETETTTYHFDGNIYQMRAADNFKILTNPDKP